MGNSLTSSIPSSDSHSVEDAQNTIRASYEKLVTQPPLIDEEFRNASNHFKVKSKNGNLVSCFEYSKKITGEKVIIWSHGNACLAYTLKDYFESLCGVLRVRIISYDYQGYGFSEGTFSEKNCYDDLESVIDYTRTKYNVDNKNIYLIGQSLGTGVVVNYISKHDWVTPTMLISPYKSILGIVTGSISDYCQGIDIFDSISKFDKVKCKTIICHGNKDELIPISHSSELCEKNASSELVVLECGHNDILRKIAELAVSGNNLFAKLIY